MPSLKDFKGRHSEFHKEITNWKTGICYNLYDKCNDVGGNMNIGARLEAIGRLVPQNVSIADIGTDHAYLPTWLAERGVIIKAVAGDITEGPCAAARNTVAMYGMNDKVEVRMGNGLSIIEPGETDVIIIAGMGAGTMIEILEASRDTAKEARKLILQPMAGASSLRRWPMPTAGVLMMKFLLKKDGIFMKSLFWNVALRLLSPPWNVK